MSAALEITMDDAVVSESLEELSRFASATSVRTRMMDSCLRLTKSHLLASGTNKQNWPTTKFYPTVARDGVRGELQDGGFRISIDHPEKPGSMRQRYYGGTINMKDKLLTIPARAEFYGHAAAEFSNLRFGMFGKGGAKFLYIAKGGTEQDENWNTNKQVKWKRKKGISSARAEMLIAYWLKESVTQDADASVIPSEEDYTEVVMASLLDSYQQWKAMRKRQ